MKLILKQRLLSWLDSYDIYNEYGEAVYSVKGKISFGHRLDIHNKSGEHIATVKQELIAFLPSFELYERGAKIGRIDKRLSLFKPKFDMSFKGWSVQGNFWEWNYTIEDMHGNTIATVGKVFNMTDTYSIEIYDDRNALYCLMVVLAIDAEKCSRNN